MKPNHLMVTETISVHLTVSQLRVYEVDNCELRSQRAILQF